MGLAAILLLSATGSRAEDIYPQWWSDYGVTPQPPPGPGQTGYNSTTYTNWLNANYRSNYAPLNLGQLKNFAVQAQAYLDTQLAAIGGAGPAIGNLTAAFDTDPAKNYVPANLGQLKAVAMPFYDRIQQVTFDPKPGINFHLSGNASSTAWTYDYPWPQPPPNSTQIGYNATTYGNWVAQNYAPANLGQLKLVFSFDLGNFTPPANLSISNSTIPDWWKVLNGLDPFAGNIDGSTDFGNGRTDLQQYQYDLAVYNGTVSGNLIGNLSNFQSVFTTSSTTFPSVPTDYINTSNGTLDFPRMTIPQYVAINLGNVTILDMNSHGDVLTAVSGNSSAQQLWSGGSTITLSVESTWPWKMVADSGLALGFYTYGDDIGFVSEGMDGTPSYVSAFDIAAEYVSGNITGISIDPDYAYTTREGLLLPMLVATHTHLLDDADGADVGYGNQYYLLLRFNGDGTVTKLGDTVFQGGELTPGGTASISYNIATDSAGDRLVRNWSATYSSANETIDYVSSYSFNITDNLSDIPVFSNVTYTHTTYGNATGNVALIAASAPSTQLTITNPSTDAGYGASFGVPFNIFGGAGSLLGNKAMLANVNGHPFLIDPFNGTTSTTQPFYSILGGSLHHGTMLVSSNISGASTGFGGVVADGNGQLLINGQVTAGKDFYTAAQDPDLSLNLTKLLPGGNLTGSGNVTFQQIAPDSLVSAGYVTNGTATRAILNIPAGLAVDNNRDGNISFDVDDQTTSERPFRFWLNNDIDVTADELDYPSVQDDAEPVVGESFVLDCNQDAIQGTRDLEDFARMWISVAGIANGVSGGNFYVGLKWTAVASGAPTIKVYAAADGSGNYLIDGNTAADQVDYANSFASYGNATGAIADESDMGNGTLITPTSNDWDFVFPQSFFANVTTSDPIAPLLFEGCQRGKGCLSLVFLTKDGGGAFHKLSYGPGIWLDLRDIKEMYERYTVGDGTNDDGDGMMPPGNSQLSTARLPDGVATPFRYTPAAPGLSVPGDTNGNKYILFVHGWNMSPWERDVFAETMLKRLYWQGYKGKFGAFQWPTSYTSFDPDTLFIFDTGEYVAYYAANALENRLKALRNTYGSGNLFLFTHSQGGVVGSEALRLATQRGDGQLVNTFVPSQAALAVHTYDPSQSTPGSFFGTSRNLTDSSLISFSAGLTAGPTTPNVYPGWYGNNTGNSAGSTVNFFNTADYALSRGVWETDQALKPDQFAEASDVHGAPGHGAPYAFTGNYSATPVLDDFVHDYNGTAGLSLHLANGTSLNDQYEIFAFAAEARSRALGASNISTNVTSSLDLQDVWPADPLTDHDYHTHPWHSAPFRFDNMTNAGYWHALLDTLGLLPP